MAPRKKKEETNEVKITEITAEAVEKEAEKKNDDSEEKSEKKVKKEVKKLSETELKRVMTDTKETLVPLTDYIACSVHLGTKVITPHMRQFVYKRRADGLAVINTAMIDDLLREAIKFLNQYEPKQVYLLCKREAGWPAARVFEEVTGIKVFTKKYTPGVTTNLLLDNFFEAEMTIICDPWIDKNALADTVRLKKPVLALCDTNNFTSGVSKIIPCNNKSRKSIGCILFILAREYCKHKKIPFTAKLTDFAGELE